MIKKGKIQNLKFKIVVASRLSHFAFGFMGLARRIFLIIVRPKWRTSSLLTFAFYLLTFYSSAHAAPVDISKEYAFGDLKSLGQAIDRLVLPAFSIATTAVTIYFIYAAFKYITSGGDKEAIAEAQKMVTHAVIGFVLLMFLFLVMNFLFFRLFGASIQLFEGF